jgi:putative selenium metabolism protein SsnA
MLILNGTVITWEAENRVLPDYGVRIENGLISEIAPARELEARYPLEPRLDARGQLIMPGNICAHTHFYGAYARGMAIPGSAPRNFPEILERLWWPLDKALDADTVRLSALVSLVDAVKHGTTTLIDHHASPNVIDGSLDLIAEAVNQAGLRAVLCYEVTDRDGLDKAHAGIAENVRFLRANGSHPRLRGTFGLHAGLTLSDETLRACVEANPAGEGFHIHVAEHEADEDDSLSRYNKRVVQRLFDHGILGDKTILAHCVHIDDAEMALIQSTNTWVTHQPRSNMNNAVGAMRLEDMLGQGIRLCLGNDGFSNNMWEDWKAAYLLHKAVHRDPRVANGADIARMGAENNAALAGRFFPEKRIGQLLPGSAADIILVDYHPFTPLTAGNLPWHILFGFEASMVTTTMVDGQVLMRDRQLLTLDEQAIADEALALAPAIWERYRANATGARNERDKTKI